MQNRRVTHLSAIVPATNAPPTLAACLVAIEAAAEPPDEVIVAERASAPGPAAARNEGADRAGGDVLVFVDADVVVHRDAFARIRRAFADDDRVPAEVEAVAVELDRLRDPADGPVGLVDGARDAAQRQHVGGRQARGTAAEHRDTARLVSVVVGFCTHDEGECRGRVGFTASS